MKNTNDDTPIYQAMDQAQNFACRCLADWKLTEWSFRWDYAKCRLGSCCFTRHEITLSIHFVMRNYENTEQIHDTILHELAHALVWEHHRERGHGSLWKSWCLRLGAIPRAVAKGEKLVSAPYRYAIRLKDTGEIVGRYYRRPRIARTLHQLMLKGRPETKGMMELVVLE